MIILSHWGCWRDPAEQNGEAAFRRSFDLGFGTKADVRDSGGRLVVSHGLPRGGEMPLEDFLGLARERRLPLAMGVRAGGLAAALRQAMEAHGVDDWFACDMSVPDMPAHLHAGVPVFSRMSEMEPEPAWFDHAAGIWLDAFSRAWYDADLITLLLRQGKRVCVASPELRYRKPYSLWRMLAPLARYPRLMLCTDLPEAARRFFAAAQDADTRRACGEAQV